MLAGYEDQKRLIEDCLLLPLLRPDVYAQLSKATRASPGTNRPRAVLFEGPPGTGMVEQVWYGIKLWSTCNRSAMQTDLLQVPLVARFPCKVLKGLLHVDYDSYSNVRPSSMPSQSHMWGPLSCAGKTTSARVISSQAAVPLVYVPLEVRACMLTAPGLIAPVPAPAAYQLA